MDEPLQLRVIAPTIADEIERYYQTALGDEVVLVEAYFLDPLALANDIMEREPQLRAYHRLVYAAARSAVWARIGSRPPRIRLPASPIHGREPAPVYAGVVQMDVRE